MFHTFHETKDMKDKGTPHTISTAII
jgi:hypothetical protein